MSTTHTHNKTPKVYKTAQERIEAEKKARIKAEKQLKEMREEFAMGCSKDCGYEFNTISFYGECDTTGLRRVIKTFYVLVNNQTGQYISDMIDVNNLMDSFVKDITQDGSFPMELLQKRRNDITIETTLRVYNFDDVMNLMKLFELDWFQYQIKTTYQKSKHYGGAEEGGWFYSNYKPLKNTLKDEECDDEYDRQRQYNDVQYINYLEFFWGQFIDVDKPFYC